MDNDLISRQAAIDYFVTNVGFHDEDGYPIEDSDELRKIWTEYFDGIPSAQPEPHWIPCSERLPEVGQSVLISVGGMYTAEGCLRENGNWAQFRWDAVQRKDMVDAWMPLPEPWKEDDHEAR